VLERAGYVNTAWEMAKSRYVLKAIVSHTSKDFADIMASILPGVLTAVEILAVSTGIGAGIGALAGGVGAGPGAAAGFAVGLEILDLLGVGFLAAYVGSKIGTVGSTMKSAVRTAWNSCGNTYLLDRAAHQFADAVGIFYSLLLQALAAYAAKEGLGRASEALGKTKYGKAMVAWLQRGKWTSNLEVWFREIGVTRAPLTEANLKTTLDFLKDRRFGREGLRFSEMDFGKEVNYIRGMDLHNPVRVRILKAGTEVVQRRLQGGATGNFFTEVGTAPESLGIDTTGRVQVRFRVVKDTEVLESTVAEFRLRAASPEEYQAIGGKQYAGRGVQFMIDNEAKLGLKEIESPTGPPTSKPK
jgi:hypothetical protein